MTDLANQCLLKIGGQVYGGWTRLEVQRSLEQIAGLTVLLFPGGERSAFFVVIPARLIVLGWRRSEVHSQPIVF